MISRSFQEQQIHGKSIFIFEDHATAFVAWSVIGSRLKNPPYVISFDWHLDTRPAFRTFLAATATDFWNESKTKVDEINLTNQTTIVETLRYLQNDEHINAAIQASVISFAFVISPAARGNKFCAECPNIFELNIKPTPDLLTQSTIAPILTQIESIRGAIIPNTTDFILDIDLDFFYSSEAVSPKNPTSFFDLVKKASAITVAEEPKYAAASIDYRYIREELLKLIKYGMES
jgi:hypothetical protein